MPRAQIRERCGPYEGGQLKGIGYHWVSQISASEDRHLGGDNGPDSREDG